MIVVDAANVVGSRPDGWWNDRAGANRRLVDEIVAAVDADRLSEAVVVVLEGEARAGMAAGEVAPGIEVVHAPGEGDATIEEIARREGNGQEVVVVTADRRLASITKATGALVRGPRWLRERIDR